MENRNFDLLDELLQNKDFDSLSTEEKAFVEQQIGGRQAFQNLKMLVLMAMDSKAKKISSSIKRDLVGRMKSKKQASSFSWMNYKTPAYLNLSFVVLAVLLVWFFKPKEVKTVERIVTKQLPAKIDTLYVQSPPDTVILEKKIRIEVPVYISKIEKKSELEKSISGDSMSDQKGLVDLLVAGK